MKIHLCLVTIERRRRSRENFFLSSSSSAQSLNNTNTNFIAFSQREEKEEKKAQRGGKTAFASSLFSVFIVIILASSSSSLSNPRAGSAPNARAKARESLKIEGRKKYNEMWREEGIIKVFFSLASWLLFHLPQPIRGLGCSHPCGNADFSVILVLVAFFSS